MNIEHYLNSWDSSEIKRFNLAQLEELGVDYDTTQFLSNIGLPEDAAPYLSFHSQQLGTLESIYNTENSQDKLLIVIGSEGAGDPIGIDIANSCEVVALDHEDGFKKRFMNSSTKTLFAFLSIYNSFIEKLIDLRGEDAYLDADFTDQELGELMTELKSVDERALSKEGNFWRIEIQNYIALRDEIRKHKH